MTVAASSGRTAADRRGGWRMDSGGVRMAVLVVCGEVNGGEWKSMFRCSAFARRRSSRMKRRERAVDTSC